MDSVSAMAVNGDRCSSRATRIARPRASAIEMVLGTAVRRTSAPLIAYSAMWATPPSRMAMPRANHSICRSSSPVSMITRSPRSPAMASGDPCTP